MAALPVQFLLKLCTKSNCTTSPIFRKGSAKVGTFIYMYNYLIVVNFMDKKYDIF